LAAFSTDKITPGVNFYYSKFRIAKLAHLRNQYLEELKKSEIDFDYLLVMDFDVDKISISGVLDSFAQQSSWDAVAAFGYSVSPRLKKRYHDTFALVFLNNASMPQTENSIKKIQQDWVPDSVSNSLQPVYAAFGGLSIYKWHLVKELQYLVMTNEDSRVEVRCEHYSLCFQLNCMGRNRIVVNPYMNLRYEKFCQTVIRRLSNLFD
jgi:hypothetical protein